MKKVIFLILSLFELPFIIIAWIDYYWNILCKTLASILGIFGLVFVIAAVLTIPISLIHSLTLPSIIFMKYRFIGLNITFEDAIEKNRSRFLEL